MGFAIAQRTTTASRVSRAFPKEKENLECLSWLWQVYVQQVFDEVLPIHDALELWRIWWIGTALATSMPFHAIETHSARSPEYPCIND